MHLRSGEKPPDHAPWLIIVKLHGQDFELVVTASRQFSPLTLGMDKTLEAALERACRTAKRFRLATIYVYGVTG